MQTSTAREQMIEKQVRPWDVLDESVLETLRTVPREHYVPPQWADLAYADTDIPLPCGKHMLRPMLVGRILQSVALRPGESVLEVGSGSGYVSACLASLGGRVRSLELHPQLADIARANLAGAAGAPIEIVAADGTQLEDSARYDVIILTASLPQDMECFQRALRPGGRLFMVVGAAQPQQARLLRRDPVGAVSSEVLFETSIEVLEHATNPPAFVF